MMDCLGDWRGNLLSQGTTKDERYTDTFQGWFTSDVSDQEIILPLQGANGQNFDVRALPIFDGTKGGRLISIENMPDGRVKVSLLPAYKKYIEDMLNTDVVVSSIFGNEHARYLYINDMPAYDFIELGTAESSEILTGQLIDRQIIADTIKPMTDKIFYSLSCLKQKLPDKKILHIIPPPPLKDIKQSSRLEVFEKYFKQYGQVEEKLRLKWYRSYCWALKKTLKNIPGLILVTPPKETLDEVGFLKPEYAEGLTHGNSVYGSIVWKKALKVMHNESI